MASTEGSAAAQPEGVNATGPVRAAVAFRRLPLQLLLRETGGSLRDPVALVDRPGPQGIVLDATPAAVRQGVRTGMTVTQARLHCAFLRAGYLPEASVSAAVQELQCFLLRYSPVAEAAQDWAGVCWLDASGLGNLQVSLRTWAEQIRQDVWRHHRLQSSVVAGHHRLATAVLALGRRVVAVIEQPDQEWQAMLQSPVSLLLQSAADRQLCERLGLRRIEDLSRLREADVRGRFSAEMLTLWKMLHLGTEPACRQVRVPVPTGAEIVFPEPVAEYEALLFAARRLLQPLMRELAARNEVVAQIEYVCELEDGSRHRGTLQPAAPTREERLLLDILRLRWQAEAWSAPVTELQLQVQGVPESRIQQVLPTQEHPPRDIRSTEQAVDRLRAMFGPEAVVIAELRSAHLPEARVSWRIPDRLGPARPRETAVAPLVRRLYARPRLRRDHAAAQWRQWGRVLLAGGWWHRWVRRRYHYEGDGRVLRWMYDDLMRGAWYEQGRIE